MKPIEWRDFLDPLRRILAIYLRSSQGVVVLAFVLSLLSAASAVLAPLLFAHLIDRLGAGSAVDAVLLGFLGYAVLLGVVAMLDDMLAYLALICAKNLDFIVATAFFERLLKKTIGFFILYNPAEIQNAQANGEDAVKDVTGLALDSLLPGILQVVLSLIVLGATISSEIVLIVVVYGAVFVAITCYANERTRTYLDAAITATQDNARFVGNAVNSMETLRHFGSERWMNDQFSRRAREVRDNWLAFCLRRLRFALICGFALATEFAVTYLILIPRYREGSLTVGDLVLFNLLLLQLNHPFEMFGRAINQLVQASYQFVPFVEMWHGAEEVEPPRGSPPFALAEGRIVFDCVGFTYEGGAGVTEIDFVAERGTITYLVGETGSGKSTVLKLALKSLEPQTGTIRVDGHDLSGVTREAWYAAIGVVPQEIMLINDTLRSNIVLGRPPDELRLRRAAARAAILPLIETLPDGFDTVVGERGLRLSGGERQRIAIARALYADPGILFLDEASSALDEATEREIMTHLRTLAGDVTILAVTHRRHLIEPGDRVVQLADGSVSRPGDATGAARAAARREAAVE
ncbi:ABC transporter ATP-binding protein [Methylobacterium aquaticum]|uniref:ABC transporter ATP-binding protein n=1 Tax=Methylobacterium aquaticum TaxID=270351 RepID=UPI003D185B1B